MEQVNLWSEIGRTLNELLERLLVWTRETVAGHAPAFLSALLVLLLGWLLAAVLRNVTAKLLRALGLDVVAERTGLRGYLRRHEIQLAPSAMAGWLLYIAILFTALVMAFDRLQLEAGSRWLHATASFVPRLLVAALLLALGAWLSRWIGGLVGRAARLGGVPFHALIGTAARVAMLVLSAVVALDYLGLASHRTLLTGLAVIVAAGLVIAGLFAICARELVGNMLARNFVANEFKPGDRVRLGDLEGEVESVGATVLRLRSGETRTLVPHGRLVHETVQVQRAGGMQA